LSVARISELLPSAFVIAFLAAVESLLSAIVADRMIGGRHRSGAELLAQGAANIVSSLFGGLPATGAIARTATNVRAGGQTPVAGIVHAITILIVMLLASSLAGYLAMPALAGLLIVTAWLMSEPTRWRERMRLSAADRTLFLLTMILTVVSNLTIAIAVGTAAGLALRILRKDVEPEEWTPADRSKL
jgi:SulP family sulfate permease